MIQIHGDSSILAKHNKRHQKNLPQTVAEIFPVLIFD